MRVLFLEKTGGRADTAALSTGPGRHSQPVATTPSAASADHLASGERTRSARVKCEWSTR
jgi:hypothetical protein